MNKICILTKNKETYFIKRLTEVVGLDLVILNPWEEGDPSSGPFSKILVRTTGVYGNDLDLDFLERKFSSFPIINNLRTLRLFRSKATQYQFFKEHALPVLPWLDLSLSTEKETISFMDAQRDFEKFLVKPIRGQGGWGIEVLARGDLSSWWKKQTDKNDLSYLMQPYLEGARECRIFFMGEDYDLTLERQPTAGVAANFQQDGEATFIETPPPLKDLAKKLIELTDVSYGAIDFMFFQNQWFILELNVVPGIQQLEKVTGLDVIRELVKHLLTP